MLKMPKDRSAPGAVALRRVAIVSFFLFFQYGHPSLTSSRTTRHVCCALRRNVFDVKLRATGLCSPDVFDPVFFHIFPTTATPKRCFSNENESTLVSIDSPPIGRRWFRKKVCFVFSQKKSVSIFLQKKKRQTIIMTA